MNYSRVIDYGSASGWMDSVIGPSSTQYGNTFNQGQDNNSLWGNNILPKGFNGVTFGGKKRRGGMGVVASAVTPLALLALQNRWNRKNIYSHRRKHKKSRKSRRRYR